MSNKQKNTKRWTLVQKVEKYAREHTNISLSYYHSSVVYYRNRVTVEISAPDGWVFAHLSRKGKILIFEESEYEWADIVTEQHSTYQRQG